MAALPRPWSNVQPSAAGVTPSSATPQHTPRASGPRVLLAVGFVLLVAWLLAMLFRVGELAHVLLLVGLMLLMLWGLKARDAATRSALGSESEKG